MYWTVCYCLTIHLITVHGFIGLDCNESGIIVAKQSCDYLNGSEYSIKIFNEAIFHSRNLTEATLTNHGCPLESETHDFDNEFYVECETEIDCPDEKDVTIKIMKTFLLECENVSLFDVNTRTKVKEVIAKDSILEAGASINEDGKPFDARRLAIVTGSAAAGLVTVGGVAAALYMLQTILQSGSYLFPNTPGPAGFTEMP